MGTGSAVFARDCIDSQFFFQTVCARKIGFVDDKHVRDFHDTGLDRLHIVAKPRYEHNDRHIGNCGDIHFILTDTDRLDQDRVETGRIEEKRQLDRAPRKPTEFAAGCHGSYEHTRISEVLAKPDPIAENGAVRIGATGINGNDADLVSTCSEMANQLIDKRTLSGTRRPCNSNECSPVQSWRTMRR